MLRLDTDFSSLDVVLANEALEPLLTTSGNGWIDFGAIGVDEIFQNIKYIILTEYFSVPLDREFGLDMTLVDKPIPVAKLLFPQECTMKISLYEPRALFRDITYTEDHINGKLMPHVTVILLTIEGLPPGILPELTEEEIGMFEV